MDDRDWGTNFPDSHYRGRGGAKNHLLDFLSAYHKRTVTGTRRVTYGRGRCGADFTDGVERGPRMSGSGKRIYPDCKRCAHIAARDEAAYIQAEKARGHDEDAVLDALQDRRDRE